MKKSIYLFSGILLFHYSCSSKTEEISNRDFSYELEIVDSLMIDFLGNPQLLSVDSENDHFLFSGAEFNELILVNREGEIVSEFKKPMDSPDSYGQFPLGGSVYKDQIAITGMNKMNLYDLDFNLKKSIKQPYSNNFIYMLFIGYDHLQPIEIDGKIKYVAYIMGAQTELSSNDAKYFLEYNTFDFIDTEEETFEPIIPFHERSRYYESETAYNTIKPTFQVGDGLIHFAHTHDSMYYEYDLKNPENFKAEKIPFDNFIFDKGFALGGEEDRENEKDRPGQISNLFMHKNQVIIVYRSGLKLDQMPEPNEDQQERYRQIMKKDKAKLIVREENGAYSKPFLLPDAWRISFVDKKGRIWAHQNVNALEYEPDMVTLYELKLVKKELED